MKKAIDVYTAANLAAGLIDFLTDALGDLGLLPRLSVTADVAGTIAAQGRIDFKGQPLGSAKGPKKLVPRLAKFDVDYEVTVPRTTLQVTWGGEPIVEVDLSFFTDHLRISGIHKGVLP